jgi:hypothetical protein
LGSHGFDDVQNQIAPIAGGGNVQEREFIRALGVITGCDFHGVTRITQLDKIHAFNDAPTCYIQAGDDAFS